MQQQPIANYCLSFLDMAELLLRLLFYQRQGNWLGCLPESVKMLPYLTAAGHYKYGQQSLPIFLQEMAKLPESAPKVHTAMMNGCFVGRRSDGSHNAVSLDMLLEQTYNADAKETNDLRGLILKPAAHTKWVTTKAITASVSTRYRAMLHLNSASENPHHDPGHSKVQRDIALVASVLATVEQNPFLH